MSKIVLNTNSSIWVELENKVCVKVSSTANNTLQIKDNGLYAQAIPGNPGSTGTGYPDGFRSNNGITSGITDPDDGTIKEHRLVASSLVHRIFTCTQDTGMDIPLRAFDKVYPGDMYRVEDTTNHVYKYYLITKTDGTHITQASSILVATVPIVTDDPIN